jgi:hypothetical protein
VNISRQNLYLLVLSVLLLIFVLVFSFSVLIPSGKEYRIKKSELREETKKLRQLDDFHNDTADILQEMNSKNRHVIRAFDTSFNADRFQKLHSKFFSTLKLSKVQRLEDEDVFSVYEVNTTSEISSPKSFYNFLDAVNKSDWIVGINFPINFKRDSEMINSSFTMRVYSNATDSNASN